MDSCKGSCGKYAAFGAAFLLAAAAGSAAAWAGPDEAIPGRDSAAPYASPFDSTIQLSQSDDELLLEEDTEGGGLLEEEPESDLLEEEPEAEEETVEEEEEKTPEEMHAEVFAGDRYPSANECATCHPKHYEEWSVSQHAYSQLSPLYLSLNNRILQLSNGSNGDFCLRCHNPVGANLGESPIISNLDRHPTSREGITCVVCHRVAKTYNKASGRLGLEEGDIFDPVKGPLGDKVLKDVLAQPETYRVVTERGEAGRSIHTDVKKFVQMSDPIFCGTCHDVTLFNGFRLEEAFSEYRLSPAAKRGVTCQDCHMGKEQGVASGYEHGPAAVVGGEPTEPRRLTSHYFAGPDYSIIHPGIFPHNVEAAKFKTLRQWLQFDVEAGWGTDEFEESISLDHEFPEAWQFIDDRYDAREIINEQQRRLKIIEEKRLEVLRNGYHLGELVVQKADRSGLDFAIPIINATDGHNVPTGFTGERLVWLKVTVTDSEGTVVYVSGDRDPNGDLRDGHSSYVHHGEVPIDEDLLSLQSIFVTDNVRGGEIEHVIPIPYPITALPRVLPEEVSLVFTAEPMTERNHKKGIEPLGKRWGTYEVEPDQLTGKGPYEIHVELIAQEVPVNLIIAMQQVGFDYGMTPKEIGDRVIEGAQVLWETRETVAIE